MSDMTITEVSRKYHINAATLRYYEQIGLLPKVPRRANGNRYYDDHLQSWLEMIICLRHSGVPVEELVKYTQLLEQGDSTLEAREQLLKEQLAMLIQKRKILIAQLNVCSIKSRFTKMVRSSRIDLILKSMTF